MWNLPRPGIEPLPPALAGRFLSIVPPGKSLPLLLVPQPRTLLQVVDRSNCMAHFVFQLSWTLPPSLPMSNGLRCFINCLVFFSYLEVYNNCFVHKCTAFTIIAEIHSSNNIHNALQLTFQYVKHMRISCYNYVLAVTSFWLDMITCKISWPTITHDFREARNSEKTGICLWVFKRSRLNQKQAENIEYEAKTEFWYNMFRQVDIDG